MQYQGVLSKMRTELGSPIRYYLQLEEDEIPMNEFIDQEVQLSFQGYQCLNCGKKKKIYRQGHCYDCFYESPQVGDWVIRPELSKAHLGIEDRNLDFEKEAQLQPHIVYLALSSDVKVGVTRKTQVPTRWIDQGANEALAILEVPNRYLAGITEVALKEHLSDKTNWRKMLKNDIVEEDLEVIREQIEPYIPEEVKSYYYENEDEVLALDFPVNQYPTKVKSLNLTKTPEYKGKLIGIKGQYFIFEDDTVFNVRGNEGTIVRLEV